MEKTGSRSRDRHRRRAFDLTGKVICLSSLLLVLVPVVAFAIANAPSSNVFSMIVEFVMGATGVVFAKILSSIASLWQNGGGS